MQDRYNSQDFDVGQHPFSGGSARLEKPGPHKVIPGIGEIYASCMTRGKENFNPEDSPGGTSLISEFYGQTGDFLILRNVNGELVGAVTDPISGSPGSPQITAGFIREAYEAIRHETDGATAYNAINTTADQYHRLVMQQRQTQGVEGSFTLGSFLLSSLTGLDMDMLGDVVLYVEGIGFIPSGGEYQSADFGGYYQYHAADGSPYTAFSPHQAGYDDAPTSRFYHVHLDPEQIRGKRILIGTDAYRKAVGLKDGKAPHTDSYSQIDNCLRSPDPAKALLALASGKDDQACVAVKVENSFGLKAATHPGVTSVKKELPVKHVADSDATIPRPKMPTAAGIAVEAVPVTQSVATEMPKPAQPINVEQKLAERGYSAYHSWIGNETADDGLYALQIQRGQIIHPDISILENGIVVSSIPSTRESIAKAEELLSVASGSSDGIAISKGDAETKISLGKGDDIIVFKIEDKGNWFHAEAVLTSNPYRSQTFSIPADPNITAVALRVGQNVSGLSKREIHELSSLISGLASEAKQDNKRNIAHPDKLPQGFHNILAHKIFDYARWYRCDIPISVGGLGTLTDNQYRFLQTINLAVIAGNRQL